jgi:hypothetical protein
MRVPARRLPALRIELGPQKKVAVGKDPVRIGLEPFFRFCALFSIVSSATIPARRLIPSSIDVE